MPKHRSRYRPVTGFSAPTGGTTIVVDKLASGGSGTKADRCRALHTDGNTLVKWAQADEAAGDHSSPLPTPSSPSSCSTKPVRRAAPAPDAVRSVEFRG